MQTKPRDASLDVTKEILIFLVVLGHVISHRDPFRITAAADPSLYGYLYSLIFSFHMPAFVLVSR